MSATRRRTHRKAFRPSCESLEGRQLLNGTPQSLHIGTVYDSLTYGTTLGYATNPTTVEDANGNAVSGNFDYTDGTNDVTDTVLNVGHYDLSVTFNPTDTTDYSSVTTTASIDITQAKIAIVADSPTITYGDSPTLTNTLYTDLGPDPNNSGQDDYQELDSTALASVAYTSALGSAPAATTDAILPAGDHTINPTDISTLSSTTARSEFLNNFDVVYGPGTLTVTPATLDVTADAQTKVYGAADPTLTYVATGFQFSDNEASVLTGALTRAAGEQVAGGPYAISQGTLAANSDYTISFTGNSLTITPATLVSVSVSAVNISYGTALVNTQLSGSASEAGTPVAGTFAYDPSVVGTVLPANVAPQSEPVIFTPTDATDYNTVTATASINVAKAILSIGTVSDSLTYGTTLGSAINPTTVQDAHGHAVAGTFDFVESGSADVTDSVLNVGHYGLSVTFNPTDTTDYSSVTTTASIDITQAKIAIVADSPTITYGDSPTLTNTLYTDLGPDPNNSGQDDYQELDSTALASVAYTSALGSAPAATTDAILSAGDHTINPTDISTLSPTPARSEFLNNFDVVYGPGTLTVTPATLDVTADAQTKVYGAADPTLTYVATGFQFSDNEASVLTGALTRAAGEQVAGGPYAISQGTLAANSDYTISFTGNSLTITPATLDVTADAQTKVYGAADPTLTYVATGFQFSDNEASVLTGALTRAAGEQVAGGPYAISQGTLAANSDYTISFTGNSLTITPATLVSVSVSAVNISYGTALVNTQLSGSASEAGTPVTGTFAYDPSVVGTVLPANVAPQSEPVIFTPTDTTDYNIVTATASINVAKAILSIGTVSDSLTYGTTLGYATDPTTVQDAHGHAVAGTFDFVESGSADVTDSVLDVGHYGLSVTFNPTDTTDYSSVTTTASIDITQAKIAIVADSPTITYGDSPTLTNTLYTDLGPDPNNSGQDDYQELDSTALASVAYTSASG